MKLLSLYVENYGKIKKTQYDFNENITPFCEENGFGKTTLASFIKAMFYGLDSYRANTKEFCDRQRFYPFGGGAFGGNLTFSMDGKTYKIERFFDEKSDVRDEVKVYCNGTATEELGEDIGKSVFGIDRESFERTVFITAADAEISSTTGINAKLNNFLDGTEDIDLDKAIKLLSDESKRYKKSRAGNDLITAEKDAIERLDYSITNAQNTQAALTEKYKKFDGLGAEISALEARVTDAQTRNVVLKDWEHYDYLLKRADAAKEDARALAEKFAEGVPEEEKLAEVEKKIGKLSALEAELKVLETRGEDEKGAKLRLKFSSYVPDEEEINAVERKLEAYKVAEKQYGEVPAYATQKQPNGNKNFVLAIALAVAAVLIAAGAVLLGLSYITAGVIVLLAGVCGGAAFISYRLAKRNGGAVQTENPEKLRARKTADELADEVKAFLLPHGYASGNGIIFDFAQFKEDASSYKNMLAEQEKTRALVSEKTAEKTNCTRDISDFFAKYGLSGENCLSSLSRLRGYINDLKAQKEGMVKFAAEAEAFKAEKHLTARPEGSAEDIAGLNAELYRLRREKADLNREITEDEYASEQLESFQSQKEEREDKLKAYKKKYELLTAAADYLKKAEQNLKDKYVKPVKDEFVKYSALLEKTLGERVEMNKDFEISFERDGKLRSDRHLSAGQRSICALCFRLALIKNMYAAQPPFLILDDPFVNLDGAHIEKVKEVISALSADMQIIYFACHESRAL